MVSTATDTEMGLHGNNKAAKEKRQKPHPEIKWVLEIQEVTGESPRREKQTAGRGGGQCLGSGMPPGSSPAGCVWAQPRSCRARGGAGLQDELPSSTGRPCKPDPARGEAENPLCIFTWLMTGVMSGAEASSPFRASSLAVSPARSRCSPAMLPRLSLAWASSPGAPAARLAALLELRWAERMVWKAPEGMEATNGTD